jgi:hypothetical protein
VSVPTFYIGTRVVDEIEWALGFDASCTLRRVVNSVPFCSRPAAWACKLGCCGHVKVVCAAHRNISEAVHPKLFICSECRATSPTVVASWPI